MTQKQTRISKAMVRHWKVDFNSTGADLVLAKILRLSTEVNLARQGVTVYVSIGENDIRTYTLFDDEKELWSKIRETLKHI